MEERSTPNPPPARVSEARFNQRSEEIPALLVECKRVLHESGYHVRVIGRYAGTMQEVCLRLMGKKLLVALAMESKFASEGLQAIDGDDDTLTAIARELVENKGIGESADSVWRALDQLRPSTSAAVNRPGGVAD